MVFVLVFIYFLRPWHVKKIYLNGTVSRLGVFSTLHLSIPLRSPFIQTEDYFRSVPDGSDRQYAVPGKTPLFRTEQEIEATARRNSSHDIASAVPHHIGKGYAYVVFARSPENQAGLRFPACAFVFIDMRADVDTVETYSPLLKKGAHPQVYLFKIIGGEVATPYPGLVRDDYQEIARFLQCFQCVSGLCEDFNFPGIGNIAGIRHDCSVAVKKNSLIQNQLLSKKLWNSSSTAIDTVPIFPTTMPPA